MGRGGKVPREYEDHRNHLEHIVNVGCEMEVDCGEVGGEAREDAAGGRRVVPPERRVEEPAHRVAVERPRGSHREQREVDGSADDEEDVRKAVPKV